MSVLTTFIPHFEDEVYPETVQVTWKPGAFYNWETKFEVEGDWSFAFSLERLDGQVQLVNETTQTRRCDIYAAITRVYRCIIDYYV